MVTEIKESRSSLGNWYLSVKERPLSSVLERRVMREEREEVRSRAMMRVSPPM